MEEKFFELIAILEALAEVVDDILEARETINGHRIEMTWVNTEVVGISIDQKEYGGFTAPDGEYYVDIDELFEIIELCKF
jgi:hypothetical protein